MIKQGYARVSTSEQDTAAQVSALKSAGCEKIFREKASGGRWDRPELHRLLDQLRKGDVLIVARLDRLSRSLRDVLAIMEKIQEAEAGFRSLTEAIDTTTAPGRMMMQMVGAFAEFERAILRYSANEQRLDWMLPVSGGASEVVVPSSDPFNRMK
jgi:DNA invertase Pin-like site-specific DNA recombinase